MLSVFWRISWLWQYSLYFPSFPSSYVLLGRWSMLCSRVTRKVHILKTSSGKFSVWKCSFVQNQAQKIKYSQNKTVIKDSIKMCQKVSISKLIFTGLLHILLMRKYLIILLNKIINIKYFIQLNIWPESEVKISGVKKKKRNISFRYWNTGKKRCFHQRIYSL